MGGYEGFIGGLGVSMTRLEISSYNVEISILPSNLDSYNNKSKPMITKDLFTCPLGSSGPIAQTGSAPVTILVRMPSGTTQPITLASLHDATAADLLTRTEVSAT